MEKRLKKILVILGPTATGKSNLAVKLAKKYQGEIISADSRQVYKGLDIGTGKITKKEMRGVRHFLLDVANPKKVFSVAEYQKMANEKIEIILKRNKLPIIVGGTGFYIQSIVDSISIPKVERDETLRKDLENKTTEELGNILKKLDNNRYKNIDIKNKVRLVRAIEIAKKIGKIPPLTSTKSSYEFLQIGLKLTDEELKNKIKKRLISRIKLGMIQEVKKLHKKRLSLKRMRQLGLEYKYLADYLENKFDKNELTKLLETQIWHYAKRQMTWFKKDKRIKWFHPKEFKKIEKEINNFVD